MDFPDGSKYTMNPKALSLVAEEVGTVAGETFDRHHVRSERAKGRAPSKGKKRATPAGASTSKAAKKKKKKKKTSASASQVRSERNTNQHSAIHKI